MKKLQGQVAIVTGGSSGMGKAVAHLFAAEGASVVVSGRNVSRGEAVAEEIRSTGGKAVFIAGDVASFAVNEHLVGTAVETFGGLHVVFSSAGSLGLGALTELSPESWHETINTNLSAVFYLLRCSIPEMLKAGKGSIVVNASIAAFKAFPKHPAYCASKGALIPLVRQVALDYGPSIRANVLCPGPVDTPLLWDSARAFPVPETIVEETAQATLMKRLGNPGDIARLALFLASDDASWITGSAFTIDGGILTKG